MDITDELRCNPVDCPGDCWKCKAASVLEAIDALHQPTDTDPPECRTCFYVWPCPTARLLHPESNADG